MMTKNPRIIPVILAGGSGTRLWPASHADNPKQFMALTGGQTLLRETFDRALYCADVAAGDVMIVTLDRLRQRTLDAVGSGEPTMLCEPLGRNTAAAIAYAASYAARLHGPDILLWVMPADHVIRNHDALKHALTSAAPVARNGSIVTFGMTPHCADTAYGYIKTGLPIPEAPYAHTIDHFTEKPDQPTAENYIRQGEYVWNSGMFVFTAQTVMQAFAAHTPAIADYFSIPRGTTLPDDYAALPSLPFDIGIMEKTDRGAVIACDIGWSDVGTWNSIWEMRVKNDQGNALSGKVACIESRDCLIESNALLIAAIGLDDVAIVETGNSVLVADKKNPRAMQALAAALQNAEKAPHHPAPLEKPWGVVRTLTASPGYYINEVTIRPGHAQSLHLHLGRCEFLTVAAGTARLTLNGIGHILQEKDHIFIPLKAPHRIENIGSDNLVIIEVQVGDGSGEEDTIRLHDHYGRPVQENPENHHAAAV